MTGWMGADAAAFAAVVVAPAFGAGDAEAAIAALGGQVTGRVGWDALDTLEPLLATRPVLVIEAQGLSGDALAGLEQVAALAGEWALPTMVAFDRHAIDPVAAIFMGSAHLLCDPDLPERVGALAVAARHAQARVARVRETDRDRLHNLGQELGRMATALARLAEEASPPDETDAVGDRRRGFGSGSAPVQEPPDPQLIRQAIRSRRLRESFFPAGLFEDPAWDMLLDLYAAEGEGARVSVSSLCIAAAVAPTTALRWIARLTEAGLIQRRPDPVDRRRAFLVLTDAARAGMQGYFAAAQGSGMPLA